MIKKYKKKPVTIEAYQVPENIFTGYTIKDAEAMLEIETELTEWIGDRIKMFKWVSGPQSGIKIPTLEGEMLASPGDYIIKGVAGEFYPCKPDIFKQTYEEVNG